MSGLLAGIPVGGFGLAYFFIRAHSIVAQAMENNLSLRRLGHRRVLLDFVILIFAGALFLGIVGGFLYWLSLGRFPNRSFSSFFLLCITLGVFSSMLSASTRHMGLLELKIVLAMIYGIGFGLLIPFLLS